jgi:hypothetical protein
MAKTKISEYSATSADNTDISNINIAEGCSPANVNNAIRTVMAQLKDQQAGTSGDSFTVGGNLSVTGTSTLTGNVTAPTQSFSDNSTKVATTAFVQTALAILYPIGSIYSSTVSTNPNTLFGFGTWIAYGAGRVLIGQSGAGLYVAGNTGGSADAVVISHTHTATVTDPGHVHGLYAAQGDAIGGGGANASYRGTPGANTSSATTGVTVANSTTGVAGTNLNLPPYVVVYMWNRTA